MTGRANERRDFLDDFHSPSMGSNELMCAYTFVASVTFKQTSMCPKSQSPIKSLPQAVCRKIEMDKPKDKTRSRVCWNKEGRQH